MELVGSELGATQYEPDLRPVAVTDDHVPALLDHGG